MLRELDAAANVVTQRSSGGGAGNTPRSRTWSAIAAWRRTSGVQAGCAETEPVKTRLRLAAAAGRQPEAGGRRHRLARRHPGHRRPLLRCDDTLPGKGPNGEVASFWVTWATSLLDPPLGGRRASSR